MAAIPSCPRRLHQSARIVFEREEDISGDRGFKVIRVVKVIKGFKGGRRGGYKSGKAGGLSVLFNKLNGVKVVKVIRNLRVFKVVKVLKISGQIIPCKDIYNILLYRLKIVRNALQSVSRMKK